MPKSTWKTAQKIINYLHEKYETFKLQDLEFAIKKLAGANPLTIATYKNLLRDMGWIKETDGLKFRIDYEKFEADTKEDIG